MGEFALLRSFPKQESSVNHGRSRSGPSSRTWWEHAKSLTAVIRLRVAGARNNGGSIAAGCRSSSVSAACLSVAGMNLVFSYLMDWGQIREKSYLCRWCLVMERDGIGIGHPLPSSFTPTETAPQPRSSQGLSKLSGTQSCDPAWRELKRCLPQLNLERQGGSRSEMNPWIAALAFA